MNLKKENLDVSNYIHDNKIGVNEKKPSYDFDIVGQLNASEVFGDRVNSSVLQSNEGRDLNLVLQLSI